MTSATWRIRSPTPGDYAGWHALWTAYNAYYGFEGNTSIPEPVSQTTWQRFFDPAEPVFARVAENAGQLIGLVHCLYHRSTTKIEPVCYLRDLFTAPTQRGRGVGRALIEAACAQARADGVRRVYWQTHVDNVAGRRLYDALAQHAGFIVYARDA